ncbi:MULTISPECIES: GNAT family N-acetyltransferase [Streptomyces]|uniref:Putative acetyltransferase n=1 Tax=Streptomyces himastatinicus ATCC 53653 TaxID=457427 RepID=D9W8X7_9ACTN|nr:MULTISPECIES: GNAT family N-acetyltransferase [Streptomyces]EFL26759.1 putative acetyltransferase [Streptomyces himastatinicus ATCC 53653]
MSEPSAPPQPSAVPAPLIRRSVLDDEQALVALERRTWSTLHSVLPAPEPPYDAFFTHRNRPVHNMVAELDGSPVGFVRLVPPTQLASNAHVRQIQGLAVDPRVRGHGVARALLRAAYEEALRQGASRITLRVLGHNLPARRLYESEGFVVEGVLRGEFLLDGAYVDDVLMGRPLTP